MVRCRVEPGVHAGVAGLVEHCGDEVQVHLTHQRGVRPARRIGSAQGSARSRHGAGERVAQHPATPSTGGNVVTAVAPKPIQARPYPARVTPKGSVFLHMLRTTDPKDIAILYLVTSFAFFMAGGLMAMLMRAELAVPGQQFLSNEQYNQLFTMHGTIMLLLYATPILFGFANYIVPLQIGAPDVAFPRLNAFSYWLFLFGGLIVLSGFLTPGGAADFGWFAYTPLSDAIHSPGVGGDLWIMGLIVAGLGTILGAVNFITTIVCLRAPGMTMFRMPMFCWTILVTAFLILLAFPVLTAALFGLLADRHLGAHVFDPANGGAILWQHLFWFFGHPEVYIVALPFFGIISEVIPVFSRKPLFGYKGMVYAVVAIAALSAAVWAHHMYATGAVLLAFFSAHQLPDRDPDRDQVRELDRHHVEGPDHVRDADAVRHAASWSPSCSAA